MGKLDNYIKGILGKNRQRINRCFSREDIQVTNRHMKSLSTLLILREMQIKTIIRYHLKPLIMAINIQSTNNKCQESVEKREPLCTVAENLSWSATMEKIVVSSKMKSRITILPSSSTPGYICKGSEYRILKRYIYPHVFCIIIHNSQDMETA